MAFKALKNFTGASGKEYKAGDTVKKADVEDRLIRGKKIEEVVAPKAQQKPKKAKVKKQEPKEEILTEVSSAVEVEIESSEEPEVETEEAKVGIIGKIFGR